MTYRQISPFHLFTPPQIATPGLIYVGGVVNIGPNNTAATYTQSLNGTLSGGIAAAPALGDFILVGSSVAAIINKDLTCSGSVVGSFAELVDLYANDESSDFSLGVHWAFAGSTPDVLTLIGDDLVNNGSIAVIQVWRNVDATIPFDVAVQPATGINTDDVTPGAITPITAGARVVVIGGSTGPPTSTVDHVTSVGYENVTYARCANTTVRKPRMGMISKAWSGSGAETPGVWTVDDLNPTNHSWAAVTLVLRQAS